MTSTQIRKTFLEFFERNGHEVRPSSPLVPRNDPTLMFTNAGMVQFKGVFLGEESLGISRAATSQKCLRVSGKHNDLEEVGRTARHHTFFEMLGNFSFGDYFKRDAIDLAWRLFTEEYGIPRDRLWATVHNSDDEAYDLWREVAGLPESRIFRLGDKDNFWQMGDTGPCGPCSEIHFDMRPEGERGTDLTAESFEVKGEAGEFLELWNLVFMQFNRSADGELHPLPKPSIDTGAGLERIASVMQGVDTNYDTDLFQPLIERAAAVVGQPYDRDGEAGVSYRVLADHARATAFLLADGVFPGNAGRGYVLRRVMRRAIRHAWLLGRREPTLVEVVDQVVDVMGDAYPELRDRRDHLLRATRAEETRFLATIDEGMRRFEEVAPEDRSGGVVSGAEAFRLYDTYGFPIDLTGIMAGERGYAVDMAGFEAALEEQRRRSREDRAAAGIEHGDELAHGWTELEESDQEFVGYQTTEVETAVVALRRQNGSAALQLRENPFYVESGGQVSDRGVVEGDGWRMVVEGVRNIGGRAAVLGQVEGHLPEDGAAIPVRARVEAAPRHDTERNHTATHLLHAALRSVLGDHVLQRGSLVAPDRLRFDFSHPSPMTPEEVRQVEEAVNQAILDDHDVCIDFLAYDDAIQRGAMALFGEKYADTVRMISVPGVSMELCGGTHVRRTGEIGLFRIVSETGTGAGVRRIEAVTGREAYRQVVEHETLLQDTAALLRVPAAMLPRRVEQLQAEVREMEKQLDRARREGAGDMVGELLESAAVVDGGARVIAREVEVADRDALGALGDRLRDRLGSGVVVLAARSGESTALISVVTDDLIGRGVRADQVVRRVAEITGGSGGGRPHMARGGVGDPALVAEALAQAADIVRSLLEGR
jgi:alanyl-tRNA synthetase